MLIRLPQDITRLRADAATRFSTKPTFDFVVGEILRCIDEEICGDEQGLPSTTVDLLNKEISPALNAVFHARTDAQLAVAVDNLVKVWRRTLPFVELAP